MQNYNSKLYTRFAKDVGPLTGKTTKLVLYFYDFSMILYEFSTARDLAKIKLR
jgi:hypothetical protein